MKDTKFRILLDIHEVRSQVTIPVKVGDVSCKIYITLVEGGKPYKIHENSFGVFTGQKGDDNYLFNNCVIENGVIRYDFTPQTVAASGILECEVRIYDEDGGVLTTPSFTIVVDERAVKDSDLASGTEFTFLDEIIVNEGQRMENERNRIEAFNNMELTVEDKGDNYLLTKTNKDGSKEEFPIGKGEDYVLTPEDKKEIADKVVTDALEEQATEYFENLEKQTEESIAKLKTEVLGDVSALEDGVSTLSQELAIERERITNLATLEDGSTSGDAELIDIRVGADGTVYSSAGESVRRQFGNLKTKLNNYNLKYTENILPSLQLIENKFVYFSGEIDNPVWRCTDYISINGGDRIKMGMTNGINLPFCALYDENYNLIEMLYSTTEDIRIPVDTYIENIKGVKYIRFNIVPDEFLPLNQNYLIIEKNALFLDNINSRLNDENNPCNTIEVIRYNSNKLINGKFINNDNGAEYTSESYKCTDFIYCKDINKIKISDVRSNSVGAFYDKDKNYISGINFPEATAIKIDYEITIPNEAYYVRLTVDIPSHIRNLDNYTIKFYYKTLTIGNVGDFCNESSIFYVNKNYTENELDKTHYNKLSDCVINATKTKNSVVYVKSGNYELLEEHTPEWWIENKIADRYVGIELKNNIKIIGVGCNVNISMTYDGDNNTYKEYLSPFCVSGSFHLENLNITSEECSYCVHDDAEISPNVEISSSGYYINCNMEHKGRTNFTSGGSIDECIGGGAVRNGYRFISGGIYESPQNCDYIISYHTNGGYVSDMRVDISNIYSETGTLLFSKFINDGLTALVSNCKLSENIVVDGNDGMNIKLFNIITN